MSPQFEFLRASVPAECQRWIDFVATLPGERQDVYFTPAYLQPFALISGAAACCVIYHERDAVLLYPFLRAPIRGSSQLAGAHNWQDIETPYGYGGPVVSPAAESGDFLSRVWDHFSNWCRTEGIVTEFVRFHPLLDNVRWAPPAMKTFRDRVTIPIQLQAYPSAVWNSPYYRAHRHMLRKAEKVGLTFHALELRPELTWFVPLYLETQDFLQAGVHTRFSMEYFAALADEFEGRAWLGVVKLSGVIKAAVVVLESAAYLHSHLMGYHRDVRTNGLTNLIYHGIALEGERRGKSIMHMGGGRTSSDEDSLLKFKESLSPERASFWLGTRCHDAVAYEKLAEEWETKYGPRPNNYLQFYRLIVSPKAND